MVKILNRILEAAERHSKYAFGIAFGTLVAMPIAVAMALTPFAVLFLGMALGHLLRTV